MLKKILNFLFCRHKNIKFMGNLHGDAAVMTGSRSVYKCVNCGKIIFKELLNNQEENND